MMGFRPSSFFRRARQFAINSDGDDGAYACDMKRCTPWPTKSTPPRVSIAHTKSAAIKRMTCFTTDPREAAHASGNLPGVMARRVSLAESVRTPYRTSCWLPLFPCSVTRSGRRANLCRYRVRRRILSANPLEHSTGYGMISPGACVHPSDSTSLSMMSPNAREIKVTSMDEMASSSVSGIGAPKVQSAPEKMNADIPTRWKERSMRRT